MAEKFAIYAGEPLALVLAGHHDQRSGRVNQVAADFLQFVAALTPEMTTEEWCAVCDALNGLHQPMGDTSTTRFLWAEIADAPELGPKWGIDQTALAAKLHAMQLPQLLALQEVVRRFWSAPTDAAPAEAVRLAGARLAG